MTDGNRPKYLGTYRNSKCDFTLRQWRRTWTLIGKRWAETCRWSMEEAAEVPLKVRLLMDCRTAFAGAPALPSVALLNRLRADEEAPWADLAGTGLTVRRLAALLREYDVCPTNHRWEDGTQSKGYASSDFTDTWSRYCPPDPETGAPRENRPNRPSAGQRRSPRYGSMPWDGSYPSQQLSQPSQASPG
jgi:hypothetical protein